MPNTEDYKKILQTYWGHKDFRGIQRDIIESIGAGHDTLGLMPTGGGKSITFQVPTLAGEGLCIVVTPLIALMKDQVANLRSRQIMATAVYSGMNHDDVLRNLDNCILGDYKFLYVSPERLGTEFFRAKLRHMKVRLIAIDEAHCISQWGYDFRPSYLKISELRALLPGIPVLALTATATPRVVEDIQRQLHFSKPNVFRMSFRRENLIYVVRPTENKETELLHILNSIPGSAIVYTRSRKSTTDLMKKLRDAGITALNYHAGLTNDDKDLRQRSWDEGETRVMVATNAFGMGIDKADVRLVIHFDAPDSPEAYFQEAGRGGRDGKTAYAVMLWNGSDRGKLLRRIPETFPPKEFVREIYDDISYYLQIPMGEGCDLSWDFDLAEFCARFKHFPVPTLSALHILTRAGYIEYRDEDETKSRLLFLLTRDELYRIHHTSPECEELIQTVLRNYGGIFSDYVFIEEKLLATRTGFTPQHVYELLKSLSRQAIIHYVPRKRTARITLLTRRLESDCIKIGEDVYENRKKEYEERIHAMIHYVETDQCRSKLLLEYFGEETSPSCGRCDVCCRNKAHGNTPERKASVRKAILDKLSDKAFHAPEELIIDNADTELSRQAVNELMREEAIEQIDGMFHLTPTKSL